MEIIPFLKGVVPVSDILETFTISLAKGRCYLSWNKYLVDLIN